MHSAGIDITPNPVFKEPQPSGYPDSTQCLSVFPDGARVKSKQLRDIVDGEGAAEFLLKVGPIGDVGILGHPVTVRD